MTEMRPAHIFLCCGSDQIQTLFLAASLIVVHISNPVDFLSFKKCTSNIKNRTIEPYCSAADRELGAAFIAYYLKIGHMLNLMLR